VLQTFALPLGYGTVFLMPIHYIKESGICQGIFENIFAKNSKRKFARKIQEEKSGSYSI